jgi:hypothetical protein
MPDWGSGGSGAASGAAKGAVIGSAVPIPGGTLIGAGAGAVIGGLRGLYGGKKKKKKTEEAEKMLDTSRSSTHNLLRDAQTRALVYQSSAPDQTPMYRTGRGVLADLMRGQVQQDASAAAQRGMVGSEFEIAQGANRANTSRDFLRNLFVDSANERNRQIQLAQQQALQAQGMLNSLDLSRLGYANADEQARGQRRSQDMQNLLMALYAGGDSNAA